MGLNTMYYLVDNWSSGIFDNCKYTANGLEVEYTTVETNKDKYGLVIANQSIVIKGVGNKISLYNPTGTSITTAVSGTYDNLDFRTEYKVAISYNTASGTEVYTPLDPKWWIYQSDYTTGTSTFNASITIPAGKEVFVIASSGQFLSIDRFYTKRVPPASAKYTTAIFTYKKTEDITAMFLPLAEGYDLSNPKKTITPTIEVASFSTSTSDVNTATWVNITNALSTITRDKPYFRLRVTFPTGVISAISKIGYAIASNFAFTEPVNLMLTKADVEFTSYRPKFKVFIGQKDVTRYVENCNNGSVTLNYRKSEEDFTSFYFKKVAVYLDGVEVDAGVITRINKTEFTNAVSYEITFTKYRELIGASYIDNAFAFNSGKKDFSSLPFNNEFEFINYLVNYSPANNGVLINTDYSKEFRSLKLWVDPFDQVNKVGGMGFASTPDKWSQNYISTNKLGMEIIESVANANMMTSNVTHNGNVILSDLIPHKDLKLAFNGSYHNDATSLLSKCTHRYNDYGDQHNYVPDFRLYTPDVSFDALQAGALVHVTGTTGLGQAVLNPTDQFVGVMRGFNTGKREIVEPGQPYNYKTQLTYREPRDNVRFTFIATNQKTSTNEQTALSGLPKIEGLENVTYASNAGNVIQPTILDPASGVKLEHKWLSSTLSYKEDTESDDVYGITQLNMDIWTDDLKDEPRRQTGIGIAVGIGIALLAGIAIVATGGAAIPFLAAGAQATVAGAFAAGGIGWGIAIGAGAALGAGLGYVSGTSSKVDVMLPIRIKGIPLIKAHQEEFAETPLIGLPNPKYFPEWTGDAYQEILLNKQAIGTETKVVNNPFIVNLNGYKPLSKKPTESVAEYELRKERNPYRSDLAEYVASGLTLHEWLKSRQVTLRYVGNPNWYPNQFIAIARQPTIGTTVTEYEYFYTTSPQSTSISVGGEISTEISASYIGTGFLNNTSENYDVRQLTLLGD